MKKQLLVGILALSSVFCAFSSSLTVKNVGNTVIDQVYVGARQPFVNGWREGAVALAPGESKTLEITGWGKQPILAIGRFGEGVFYIEQGKNTKTNKPMLGFTTYNSGFCEFVKAVEVDDNGNATVEIEALISK